MIDEEVWNDREKMDEKESKVLEDPGERKEPIRIEGTS